MGGISILIVDDDKLLVDKLEKTVHWKEIGISMVFTALNIRQAKAVLEEYSIQILLCDIDMPQGNGLELVEWIREKGLDIECVFLSSYANFAYAQMALKLSSRDYLLKPISNANLETALRNVIHIVEDKISRKIGYDDIHTQKAWIAFFRCGNVEQESAEIQALREIYKKDEVLCIQLIRIWSNPSQQTYKKEILLFDNALRNHAENFFGVYTDYLLESVIRLSDVTWVVISRLPVYGAEIEEKGMIDMKEWSIYLGKSIPHCIDIYQGKPVTLDKIGESWHNLEAMERYAVMNENGILFEKCWVLQDRVYHSPSWEIWEKELLQTGQIAHVRDSILDFIEKQRMQYGWRKDTLEKFLWEFQIMLYKYWNSQGINLEDIFETTEYEAYNRRAYASMKGVKAFIHYVFEKLDGYRATDNRQENVVQQLKLYIEKHLGDDLSRNALAKQVYLSEDYISRLFMKATGMSLPSYIAMRRMEKAKEYLKDSCLPVSKIAIEVGYGNFSYFSKTFREHTGCTPNEYRSRVKK